MAKRARDFAVAPFVALFSLTLFLSAALMFAVQPMIGKMLLPLVGGSPAGWVVTMAYFQLALLLGYGLAHLLSRLSVRVHAAVVCLALLIGVLAQPLSISDFLMDSFALSEALRVFFTLLVCVTLPFVAIAMLSPSLQRVFANSKMPGADNPYFLFAASNLGSFAGLLLYPLWFERSWGLLEQSSLWRGGYTVLILMCFVCIWWSQPSAAKPKAAAKKTSKVSEVQRWQWVLLSFVPSSLLVGVTAHITTDVGSVPFFWIVPLALYLLTFVLAFMGMCSSARSNAVLRFLQAITVVVMAFLVIQNPNNFQDSLFYFQMLVPLLVFFFTALYCHVKLAAARPEAGKLTEYYLWISAGGALGGSFNAFVAPFLLPLPYEFMLVAFLSGLISYTVAPIKKDKYLRYAVAAAILMITAFGILKFRPFPSDSWYALGTDAVLFAGLLMTIFRPRIFIPIVVMMVVVALFVTPGTQMMTAQRNFFGVLRVFDELKSDHVLRTLIHGTTLHGYQIVRSEVETTPNSYYDPRGPLGDIMHVQPWQDVGIIGMGTAEIVCYRATSRHFTYYEIDPHVPEVASQWFGFMRECGKPVIKLGDGRRTLTADAATRHDLLIVDAFTSDAIPVHLLTKEAVQAYFDRLKPDGMVAFHVSNRYYSLAEPLRNVADALKLKAARKVYDSPDQSTEISSNSEWIILTRDEKNLGNIREFGDWNDLPSPKGRLWTDDYSNLLDALKMK